MRKDPLIAAPREISGETDIREFAAIVIERRRRPWPVPPMGFGVISSVPPLVDIEPEFDMDDAVAAFFDPDELKRVGFIGTAEEKLRIVRIATELFPQLSKVHRLFA
jgi:hypothetical protein